MYVTYVNLAAGCPSKFVNYIKECITNSRFTIALNGSLVGYFQGGKGLRQSDPISAYLFVIAMEGFTRVVNFLTFLTMHSVDCVV